MSVSACTLVPAWHVHCSIHNNWLSSSVLCLCWWLDSATHSSAGTWMTLQGLATWKSLPQMSSIQFWLQQQTYNWTICESEWGTSVVPSLWFSHESTPVQISVIMLYCIVICGRWLHCCSCVSLNVVANSVINLWWWWWWWLCNCGSSWSFTESTYCYDKVIQQQF